MIFISFITIIKKIISFEIFQLQLLSNKSYLLFIGLGSAAEFLLSSF